LSDLVNFFRFRWLKEKLLKMYLLTSVLTFVLQSELARIRAKNLGADLLFLFILGIAVVIFIIILIVIVSLSRKKRVDTHQNFAVRHGWQAMPNEDLNFIQNPQHYSLFMNGEGKDVYGVIQKPFGSGNLFAFEYKFRVGDSKETNIYSQTVVCFHSPNLNLPYFSLYPEDRVGFIGSAFGYNDVNFESHPYFSKRYRLSTNNEGAIRQVFNPQILSNLELLPTINIDGGGQYLFIYELKKISPPEQFDSFINERMKFVNLFVR
jgi:hypothetical protein